MAYKCALLFSERGSLSGLFISFIPKMFVLFLLDEVYSGSIDSEKFLLDFMCFAILLVSNF